MKFSVSQENYTMEANVEIIGQDLLITITGGDSPHIGTVTTLTSSTEMSSVCFPSHDGRLHKDNVLGERIGKIIQADILGSCTITSGVHVDHITKKQIMVSSNMASDLGKQLLNWIRQTDFTIKQPRYYSKNEQPK